MDVGLPLLRRDLERLVGPAAQGRAAGAAEDAVAGDVPVPQGLPRALERQRQPLFAAPGRGDPLLQRRGHAIEGVREQADLAAGADLAAVLEATFAEQARVGAQLAQRPGDPPRDPGGEDQADRQHAEAEQQALARIRAGRAERGIDRNADVDQPRHRAGAGEAGDPGDAVEAGVLGAAPALGEAAQQQGAVHRRGLADPALGLERAADHPPLGVDQRDHAAGREGRLRVEQAGQRLQPGRDRDDGDGPAVADDRQGEHRRPLAALVQAQRRLDGDAGAAHRREEEGPIGGAQPARRRHVLGRADVGAVRRPERDAGQVGRKGRRQAAQRRVVALEVGWLDRHAGGERMQQLGHVAEVLVEARAGEAGDQPDLLARVHQVACRLARRVERDVEDEQQADRQGHGEQAGLDAEAQGLRRRRSGTAEKQGICGQVAAPAMLGPRGRAVAANSGANVAQFAASPERVPAAGESPHASDRARAAILPSLAVRRRGGRGPAGRGDDRPVPAGAAERPHAGARRRQGGRLDGGRGRGGLAGRRRRSAASSSPATTTCRRRSRRGRRAARPGSRSSRRPIRCPTRPAAAPRRGSARSPAA